MKLGAHVSTSGGIQKSIERGAAIGCEAIQIFGSAPQSWAFKPAPAENIEAFQQQREEAGIDSVFSIAYILSTWATPSPPT